MTYSFLIALAVVYIFPFVIAIVTSFKTEPNATVEPARPRPAPGDDDRRSTISTRARTFFSG